MNSENTTLTDNSIIQLDLLYGDAMINNFIHTVGVFEKGKQLAEYVSIIITGNPNLKTLCENMKNSLEASKRNVVFVGIRSFDGRRAKEPNAYIKPLVQFLSDGKRFNSFKNVLEDLGYKVEVNNIMQVISVSA